MCYQIFFSPQVKRYTFITYKHGLYQLSHELANDLRLGSQETRKYQKSVHTPQNDSPVPSPPAKSKILPILAKNLRKAATKPLPQWAIPHGNQSQSPVTNRTPENSLKSSMKIVFIPLLQTRVSRSTCSHMLFKIVVLKNFANFSGKYLCQSLSNTRVSLSNLR